MSPLPRALAGLRKSVQACRIKYHTTPEWRSQIPPWPLETPVEIYGACRVAHTGGSQFAPTPFPQVGQTYVLFYACA